ncbi:M48 family metallopeptidase [Actinomarinicola tropica]|uniref:M48 family metalloprotease n=1 Tax=Actinomarinicola tropica TaxID=2789776 RepID=A0A5Q2RPT5_9ACTN|nr:M48 family metallopeptidase [Actinomarinicola tropica]QGG96591.1 M48 family metalloprotease [Actinomarinicola tropica]
MARRSASLRAQAALAVALIVGFHVLVVGLALLFIAAPVLELVYVGRLHLYVLVLPVVGWSLLKALVPRKPPFQIPGPRVTAETQPDLMALVERVAREVGEPPPAGVFLIDDVNAFVTTVGGRLGVGGHRILAVGVPLMRVLEPEELESVIAHEFGHFHGGDVELGPILYQMRGSLTRTLAAVDDSFLRRPFMLYAELYLSVTQGLSRAQEHAADRLAARVTSPATAASALARLPLGSMAFQTYWQTEYGPVLEQGYRAPYLSGFDAFLDSPTVAQMSATHADVALGTSAHSKFDSHPPVAERISALGVDPAAFRGRGVAARPATSVLRDLDGVAEQLEEHRLRGTSGRLLPLSWDDVAEKLILPAWLDSVAVGLGRVAPGATAADLPTTRDGLAELGETLHDDARHGRLLRPEREAVARRAATHIIGAATVAAGFRIVDRLGVPPRFEREGEVLDVLGFYDKVLAGEIEPAQWTALVAHYGLDATAGRLASFAPTTPPAPGAPLPPLPPLGSDDDLPAPPKPEEGAATYRDVPPGQGALGTTRPLVVEADALAWGDVRLVASEVEHLALGARVESNGGGRFSCRLLGAGREIRIELTRRKGNAERWNEAVGAVSTWCQQRVEPLLVDRLLQRFEADGGVEVAGVVVGADGITVGAATLPWADVAGAGSDGRKVTIWRTADNLQGAAAFWSTKTSTLDAVLVPTLVEAVRRTVASR